ncbi:MAG: hypothetical protein HUU14_03875 [Dehalococcoidia bacterium]|nr:MAG: hypothetical protein EDM76_01520 [bacterium]MCE7927710.1 hypothetical protein [Chloroflexi bacterium CFX7]MCK6565039.1 hypothetical protein [Dehalococcoidia bacterium]MCL4231706.1 hypothetical protein [Dehalococcoidia bacterium]NUQ55007.1 hypothetical protein [Dehalococcoidia bacterium]
MKREEIAALIAILQAQLALGQENVIVGSWKIGFDRRRQAFTFDKCENDGYCEERPAVVSLAGEILDPGGPLFGD